MCAYKHSDLQSGFRNPELERKKERGRGYFWSGSVFIARPSSAAVTDLKLKLH